MSQITTFSSGGGGGGGILTLTANSGGAVSPTGGNINVIGDGATINVVGDPGTSTLTISATGGGGGIATITGDDGTPLSPTAGNLNIITNVAALNSGASVQFSGSGSTLTLNLMDGNGNIFLGSQAGNATVAGQNNIGIGYFALSSITSSSRNLAIGYAAGDGLISGSNNIILGVSSGTQYGAAESGNILIGNEGVASENNTIHIGATGSFTVPNQTACYIAGVFGVTVGVSGIPVVVDNTGKLGTVVSSLRFKQNVKDLGTKSEDIFKLRPVAFSYKKDESNAENVGLIAEEVESVMPSLVVRDDQGLAFTVKYQDLPVLLLNEIQKLKKDIEALKGKCCG